MFSNQLTSAEAERLAMLAEEAGEVVQAVGKVLRHGYASRHPDGGPDNRETLQREVTDLSAVLELMRRKGDLAPVGITQENSALARKMRFAHHQATAPTPTEDPGATRGEGTLTWERIKGDPDDR